MELDLGRDRKGTDQVLSAEEGRNGSEAEPGAETVDFLPSQLGTCSSSVIFDVCWQF